jgi:hypothetical protein
LHSPTIEEILHEIRVCVNCDEAERKRAEIVLVFQLAIHRHERVKLCRGAPQ